MSDYTLTAQKQVLEMLCQQYFDKNWSQYYNNMIDTLKKCTKNNTFDEESTKMIMKEIFPILNELSSTEIKRFLDILDILLLHMYNTLPVEQMLKQSGFFQQCIEYVDQKRVQKVKFQLKKTE
ncbi:Hypothetical_protein [Hexamita inflata]|uniref:Hypothetical_protein n=1 Tax=Hexamita inflata TaxID=28002 RepID=A0ABP1GU80_9EUKA